MSNADLRDPRVLTELRSKIAVFLQQVGAAIDGSAQQVRNTADWLRYDLMAECKRTLVNREEAYQQARRTWLSSEADVQLAANSRGPGKPSSLEEKIDMDKARRRRDEAEARLVAVKRCLDLVERQCSPLTTTLRGCDFALRDEGVKALARLAAMATAIEDYLRQGRGT